MLLVIVSFVLIFGFSIINAFYPIISSLPHPLGFRIFQR